MNKLQKKALVCAIIGGLIWIVSGIVGFAVQVQQMNAEIKAFIPEPTNRMPILISMLLSGLGLVGMIISLVVYVTSRMTKSA